MCAATSTADNARVVVHRKKHDGEFDHRQPPPREGLSPKKSDDALGRLADVTGQVSARRSRHEPHFVLANAGDHAIIHQFLTVVFQGPSHDAFVASLDDPFYEPSDRLLIKRGHQILAHLHLTRRVIRFGSLRLPSSGLGWLGTLPEFRERGFATRLMQMADRLMVEEGTAIACLRTSAPHFFRRFGWAVCGRHCHSRGSTRDLLAHLATNTPRRRRSRLRVRPWRQVELPALMRLYHENTSGAFGTYDRTEAYWRWLISRKVFDQIFVAFEGPDKFDPGESDDSISGYAITKQDRILEMMTAGGHSAASKALMARACREAIERDNHAIMLDAPPDDPRHRLIADAGGSRYYHEADQGEVFMVKLLDPLALVRALGPEFKRRADAAGLPLPCELGLLIEGAKYRLLVTRRAARISKDKLGRSYLACNHNEFARLLMGHVDIEQAAECGRLEASTRIALQTAQALFPRLPTWRSPLDEMCD